MVLFFTHIPFVVNHTFNATPPERLEQEYHLFLHLGWIISLILVMEDNAVQDYLASYSRSVGTLHFSQGS